MAARQLRWHEIRRRRKSEGGQKFLPPNPFPFCPPELKSFSKRLHYSVRNHFPHKALGVISPAEIILKHQQK